jgi:hypothetical protein
MKNRRNVLAEMAARGGFSKAEVRFIRDGLLQEGWKYHEELPVDWMYKQYCHKIEGIDTNVLYHLSPDGTIYRSKKMLMKKGEEGMLGVDTVDLLKLINFKPAGYQGQKTVEDPDENWIYDPDCVPEGWKMRKYCFNNMKDSKVEEIYHYLTPDNTVLRGRKHVYNYMLDTETFNQEDFGKFHFSKRDVGAVGPRRPSGGSQNGGRREAAGDGAAGRGTAGRQWGPWGAAEDMPAGWMVGAWPTGGS